MLGRTSLDGLRRTSPTPPTTPETVTQYSDHTHPQRITRSLYSSINTQNTQPLFPVTSSVQINVGLQNIAKKRVK